MDYYKDHLSEVESEVSAMQIPTPKFGESYSQSGCSPVMQRKETGSGMMSHNNRNFSSENRSHSSVDSGFQNMEIGKSEKEDDIKFIENDSYITFTASPKFESTAPPKFEISKDNTRGSILETVQVRQY